MHSLASDGPRSRWRIFSAAPHRMLFLGGAAQIVLVMLLWFAELAGRVAGWSLPWTLPATWVHAWLMVYGVFPFFIFGFLFTVYPRWLAGAPVSMPRYAATFMLLTAGMALFYVGIFSARTVLLAGVALYAAGWMTALVVLWSVYAQSRQRGPHEPLLNAALAAGLAGVVGFGVAIVNRQTMLYDVTREAGLWLFLTPVVFLVAHRMVPFFSHAVLMNYLMRRPAWAPPLMIVCVGAHVALDLAGLSSWRFLADLPLAIAALHLSWTWQFRASFRARLLAMLHIAFLWLGIAMTLYTTQSLMLLVTGTDVLGRAPLHALGIGFFTGMVVAMASRVTLGHSGRTLQADRLTWATLMGVNIAAVLRIAGELWPLAGTWLNVSAGAVWLAALAVWVGHYVPMYLRPRIDRQPG